MKTDNEIIDEALIFLNKRKKRVPDLLVGYFSTHEIREERQRNLIDIMIANKLIKPLQGFDTDIRLGDFKITKRGMYILAIHQSFSSWKKSQRRKRNSKKFIKIIPIVISGIGVYLSTYYYQEDKFKEIENKRLELIIKSQTDSLKLQNKVNE